MKVPYETLNKRFRAAQKNIDRETSHVTMVVAELEKTLSSCPAVDSVVSLLDGVVEKLSVLKRKVTFSCLVSLLGLFDFSTSIFIWGFNYVFTFQDEKNPCFGHHMSLLPIVLGTAQWRNPAPQLTGIRVHSLVRKKHQAICNVLDLA